MLMLRKGGPIMQQQLHVILLCGMLGSVLSERPWGTEFSASECSRISKGALLPDILGGQVEPYAFTGPSPNCTAEGCKHLYWGPRCRWAGDQPACPLETRNSLINLLKGYAHQGAEWAQNSLSLQPCELWEIIKGRTLWFVGDSITQETSAALICFLVEYHTSFEAPPISDDPDLMHRLTHNANSKRLATFCHQFEGDTKMCMLRANFGPRVASVIIPALTKIADPEDIVVINFGLWSNSLDELDLHSALFQASFQYHKASLPKRTFWRETSAQHYQTPSGMYNPDKPIQDQRCVPTYPGVNITIDTKGHLIPVPGMPLPELYGPEDWELQVILQGGHRNKATQKVIDGLGIHTIPAWNTSMAMWSYHHHVHDAKDPQTCAAVDCDCTHACSPSWSQIWLPEFVKAFSTPELWLNATDVSKTR